MNKLLMLLAAFTIVAGCRKLDVKVESQYIDTNFPKTPADFQALIGPIYTQLASRYAVEYFRMQELSTDEAILPGRDGNYDDNGQYRQHHYHTYTKDHVNVKEVWEWGFGAINTCNRIISNINHSTLNESDPLRVASLAEVKAMRALFYFFMMDIYGNIPIVDTFPVANLPGTKPRKDVFTFIENDIKSVMYSLPARDANNAQLTYGHPTRGMAFSLLAKLYINAKVYTGVDRTAEALSMCDSVIANKNYKLHPSYSAVFAPDNGPLVDEIIFSIPYDALLLSGQQFTRHGFMAYLYPKYSVPSNLSISMSTTPEFYDRFNLPGDERNDTWLIGKQYNWDGTPFTLKIKKKDLDASYTGTNTDTVWQLEITKKIVMRGQKPFDVGNDYLARCMGVRSIKFYPDKSTTAATRMSGNDMAVFRLADIYLLKAEALFRAGQIPAALEWFNKVRARAKAPLAATLNEEELLNERGRELYWENWRRNDLIRFGKYETDYAIPGDVAVGDYKPGMDKDERKRIFPIPASEIKLNPNLKQNDSY